MAQLALAVVGAGIGSVFGQAALGFAIGSTLGGFLFPAKLPDIQGPRVSDLRVQNSAYGLMVPIVYGTARIAGNVIWSTPIKETVHRTRVSGGKGGPKQTQTSYTYSASLAVSLCEGPITGVRRIWANGKVIYDVSDTATTEALLRSNQNARDITIYTGTETQLPDPLIESFVGVGDVPGYRGQAYVVFDDFQLADYGNVIPNFTFEVVNGATAPTVTRTYAAIPQVDGQTVTVRGYPSKYALEGNAVMLVGNAIGTLYWAMYLGPTVSRVVGGPFPTGPAGAPVGTKRVNSNITAGWGRYDSVDLYALYFADGSTLQVVPPATFSETSEFAAYDSGLNLLVLGNSSGSDTYVHAFVGGNLVNTLRIQSLFPDAGNRVAIDITSAFVYLLIPRSPPTIARFDHRLNYLGSEPIAPDLPSVSPGWIRAAGASEFYVVTASNGVYRIVNGVSSAWMTGPNGTEQWFAIQSEQVLLKDDIIDQFTLYSRVVTAGALDLSTVVSDLCARAGLEAPDIDTTALTDDVDGFVIASQMPARRAIEPLQRTYFFDAVESDQALRFVKRGGAPVATVPEDDLGAVEFGQTPVEPLEIVRGEEADIPATVNVVYNSQAKEYQQATQQARRITTLSREATTVELPLALANDKARQVAELLLHDAWVDRTRLRFRLTRGYAALEPTDVINVERGAATHTLRLVKKAEGRPGVLELEAVAEEISVYEQTAPGGDEVPTDDVLGLAGPTTPLLLDIPLLRDQDDNAGFYAAVAAYEAGWPGAVLYRSEDDGQSYDQVQAFLLAATWGTASTTLGNFTGGNIFDETNSVTVTLTSGELESRDEVSVLNGANACLLGSEILQFRTATLIAEKQYTLSGLLRGRRGTEAAIATHVANERFILLEADALRRIVGASAELNLERDYKAVTIGGVVQDTLPLAFTNTGRGLRPYSGVQLGGGRNAAGDLTINWVRRTRVGGEWRDNVDASLGEASESYEIEIWTSGFTTLKRTLTASSQTVTYTATDQTTDFGAVQASVSVRVYQLSATVGRGDVLQGVI
jgi:hypothetical protein